MLGPAAHIAYILDTLRITTEQKRPLRPELRVRVVESPGHRASLGLSETFSTTPTPPTTPPCYHRRGRAVTLFISVSKMAIFCLDSIWATVTSFCFLTPPNYPMEGTFWLVLFVFFVRDGVNSERTIIQPPMVSTSSSLLALSA